VGLKAAPALAAGNCFIIKPSEKTPLAALALGPLIREAGFPPGVLQILPGDATTGALLASHMRIRKISVTGSVATGKKIQALAAASNLKEVTLELGGKSPAVVFEDADLDNAVRWTVTGITVNTGQVCFAPSRVYVQASIFDRFVEKYKAAVLEVTKTIGDPDEESTGLGPVVDEAHFRHVNGFIQRAKDSSSTLAVGGGRASEQVCTVWA
jgi:aldehyde dehydrogenase (NAD+)